MPTTVKTLRFEVVLEFGKPEELAGTLEQATAEFQAFLQSEGAKGDKVTVTLLGSEVVND